MNEKKTIAVVFGGCSPEYNVSLESAAGVLAHLARGDAVPRLAGGQGSGDIREDLAAGRVYPGGSGPFFDEPVSKQAIFNRGAADIDAEGILHGGCSFCFAAGGGFWNYYTSVSEKRQGVVRRAGREKIFLEIPWKIH